MKFIASKRSGRVINFALAALLVVSTIATSGSFIFNHNANAVTSNVYSNVDLNGFNTDRTYPSGGAGINTFDGRSVLQLNVSHQDTIATEGFTRYEGLVKTITPSNSIKGELYVDPNWPTSVRAGIWGGGYDSSNTPSSYPVIEYNGSSATHWRIFDNDGWHDVTVSNATTGWNKIELTINKNDSTKTDIYVNDVKVGTSVGDPTTAFQRIYVNNFNKGDADYAVYWSNFQDGNVPTDYSNVYVSPTGSDDNNGVSAALPFQTIQKALDTVAVNGTVHVADGDYYGTAQFKKSGTSLIGTSGSRDTAVIHPEPSSGQAGVYAEGLNDITIQNIAVFGTSAFNALPSSSALIKLSNGQRASINNVVVKSQDISPSTGARTNSTGININSFSDVSINNSYIAGVAKDGISVKGHQNSTITANNVSITNTSVSGAGWSGISFETTDTNITGVVISNDRVQYGQRGILFDGTAHGNSITGVDGAAINLDNTVIKDNTDQYINNAQSADVNASTVVFDHQARTSWDDVAASDLTSDEIASIRENKIIDKANFNGFGTVIFGVPLAQSVVTTGGWMNSVSTINWTPAGNRDGITYDLLYSTDRYNGYAPLSTAQSTTSFDATGSATFATPQSYFLKVVAHEGNTTTVSNVSEIQVIGSLAITGITGSRQVNSTATVNWSPIYGREQFQNYQVYVDGDLVSTIADPTATSANITLPSTTGPVDVYVKANFANGIGGSNFRQSESETVTVIAAPAITPIAEIVTEAPAAPAQQAAAPAATTGFSNVIGATANQAAVLGATTDNGASTDAAVKGATDDKTAAAVNSDANQGKIFGLAWYWWILILAALAAIAWFIVAAVRRRNEEQA